MRAFGPIRTALFVPGNRPDRVDKAVNAGADAVIIDLEDAVPFSQKQETRPKVRDKLLEHGGTKMVVRINALDTEFFAGDVEEIVVQGLRCLMLPKVENADHLRRIHKVLLDEEKKKGMEPGEVWIIPLIESAAGVQNIFSIVSERLAPHRLFTVALGAADYTLDMGIEITQGGKELDYPRASIAVACRAAGVEPPLDTPFMLDLKNLEWLKADAVRAKQLGFQGKLCIHPNQIETCHDVFSPTDEEIQYARRVIQAFEEAEAKGVAAIQLEGKFIDYPVVERSRRILRLAAAIASN